ncbi:unnamed protein product [Cylindrotheca closterium]|uniref:Uncharacterized protein n=1 Tax=Cylindrotheca closterium TaxID=2856 RepID=A0AAD2PXI4_9STRA|nr:unnamed protein product [Cylindrotheca closterium]
MEDETFAQAGLNDTGSNIDLGLNNETIVGDLNNKHESSGGFEWTALTIAQAIVLFFLAGVAEIVGGWMVWMYVRGGKSDANVAVNETSNNTTATTSANNDSNVDKPWWWGLVGSLVLIIYGFIPCLQPTDSFGRIYAAYGGFFIVFSFLFGWAVDGDKPDIGDVIGGCICFVGAGIIFFWPR